MSDLPGRLMGGMAAEAPEAIEASPPKANEAKFRRETVNMGLTPDGQDEGWINRV